jgi:pyrroline-5-carboxylate reductase
MKKIGIIGTGNMGEALLKSFIKLNYEIVVFDIDKKKLNQIKKKYKVKIVKNNKELEKKSDIIILAVKPQSIDKVINEIKKTNKLVISIAAGISINYLKNKMVDARIIRVMPNIGCLIGEMAAGYSFEEKVKIKDKEIGKKLLSSAGIAFEVKEDKLDIITALSGSGPGFITRIIEYFIDSGKKLGLPEKISKELTLQTFMGTVNLLIKKSMDTERLIRAVSSKDGTTVAGRKVLENSETRKVIYETINNARKRSTELKQ